MCLNAKQVPQDLRAYQGKEVKRALKQGAKRQDLGPPPPPGAPGSQSWRDIVHEAATLPAPPQPVAITSFTAEELARSLVLSGTSRHRDDRVGIAHSLYKTRRGWRHYKQKYAGVEAVWQAGERESIDVQCSVVSPRFFHHMSTIVACWHAYVHVARNNVLLKIWICKNELCEQVVLEDLLKEMEEINWKGWGNPFTVEITRENAVEMGVPDYFLICKKSRSLVRIPLLSSNLPPHTSCACPLLVYLCCG